jgi:thiamine-monophosphate kinase
MTLRDIGEFGFIRRIRNRGLVRPEGVVRGIGDDAAAFRATPGRLSLVTTDLLLERVHFLRDALSAPELGWKAMAVNLSDIAAMGGIAREAFVGVAVPQGCELDYLDGLFAGMREAAARHAVNILGGDTTASHADLAISIAVYGEVPEHEMLTRDAARPGDVICATGGLGDSRAGLHLITGNIPIDTPELERLRAAHVRPEPHLREGRLLAASGGARAAIDVSDGLSSDLAHIVEESRVGARLFADRVPVSDALRHYCDRFGRSALAVALSGGEDYVLLATVAPDRATIIAERFAQAFGRPLHRIGEITDTGVMEIVDADGAVRPLAPTGWDHFGGDTHDAG